MDTLASTVWSFVRENLATVIGWLVVIGASALLAPYVTHLLRRSSDSRDAHFAELKQELIAPMLEFVRQHILPVLEHRIGNVGMSRQIQENPSAGVLESSGEYTEGFRIQESREAPIDPMLDSSDDPLPADPSGSPLFLDGRRHFEGVFREWDRVVSKLADYHVSCIAYVKDLRAEFARASRLPEFCLDPKVDAWVYSTNLALVVFYRQLGLDKRPFSLVPEGANHRLTYGGSYTLAQGPPAEIDKVVSKIDELMRRRREIDGLTATAASIKAQALRLVTDLEGLLLRRTLHGRCSYV